MTNRCGCQLRITGPEKDLMDFAAFVLASRCKDTVERIHLIGAVAPIPEELKGIFRGVKKIDGMRYERWHEAARGQPERGLTNTEQEALEQTYGAADRESWRDKYWYVSTEVDRYTKMCFAPEEGILLNFLTDVVPPDALLRSISQKWERLLLHCDYDEVCGGYFGTTELHAGRLLTETFWRVEFYFGHDETYGQSDQLGAGDGVERTASMRDDDAADPRGCSPSDDGDQQWIPF
jgi:hypothetical protein